MTNRSTPDYKTIRAAVAGEKWAVEKVVACYQEQIDRKAAVKKCQSDGTVKEEIDADMRQYITMKPIEALSQFPLEELGKQNRK